MFTIRKVKFAIKKWDNLNKMIWFKSLNPIRHCCDMISEYNLTSFRSFLDWFHWLAYFAQNFLLPGHRWSWAELQTKSFEVILSYFEFNAYKMYFNGAPEFHCQFYFPIFLCQSHFSLSVPFFSVNSEFSLSEYAFFLCQFDRLTGLGKISP